MCDEKNNFVKYQLESKDAPYTCIKARDGCQIGTAGHQGECKMCNYTFNYYSSDTDGVKDKAKGTYYQKCSKFSTIVTGLWVALSLFFFSEQA